MTAQEHRQLLESRGFAVATTPFQGGRGLLWHAKEPALNDSLKQERFGPHNLFIDLVSGAWQRWGETTWQAFSRGPWHEQVSDLESETESSGQQTLTSGPSAVPSTLSPALPTMLQSFLDDCFATGFTWDAERNATCKHTVGDFDTGNRWLLRDGVSYFASCRTREIVGRVNGVWTPLTFSHVCSDETPLHVQQIGQKTASKFVPLPRRELSAVKVPVQSSGRTLQKALF